MKVHIMLDGVLLFAMALTGTSLVSMLGVFMGSTNPALQLLLTVQMYAIPVAAAAFVGSMGFFFIAFGLTDGCRQLWRRLPGWLLFAFVSVNSLVLAALEYSLHVHAIRESTAIAWEDVIQANGGSGTRL